MGHRSGIDAATRALKAAKRQRKWATRLLRDPRITWPSGPDGGVVTDFAHIDEIERRLSERIRAADDGDRSKPASKSASPPDKAAEQLALLFTEPLAAERVHAHFGSLHNGVAWDVLNDVPKICDANIRIVDSSAFYGAPDAAQFIEFVMDRMEAQGRTFQLDRVARTQLEDAITRVVGVEESQPRVAEFRRTLDSEAGKLLRAANSTTRPLMPQLPMAGATYPKWEATLQPVRAALDELLAKITIPSLDEEAVSAQITVLGEEIGRRSQQRAIGRRRSRMTKDRRDLAGIPQLRNDLEGVWRGQGKALNALDRDKLVEVVHHMHNLVKPNGLDSERHALTDAHVTAMVAEITEDRDTGDSRALGQ